MDTLLLKFTPNHPRDKKKRKANLPTSQSEVVVRPPLVGAYRKRTMFHRMPAAFFINKLLFTDNSII